MELQLQIRDGSGARWKPRLRHRSATGSSRHQDRGLTLFIVGSTVLAIFIVGMVWIWSGWPNGANGVAFTAIACCFFAGLDRPAPAVRSMLIWCVVAYALVGIYLFAILPRVNDFEMLVLTLAPGFLLVGALIPRPELSMVTLLMATNFTGDLGLTGRFVTNFTSYVDGGLSVAAGLIFALAWTKVTRTFGASLAARRLVRAGWTDLARLAAGTRKLDHANLVSRTIDRLGQLVPRLASDPTPALKSIDGLGELRIGYNITALQRDRRALPRETKEAVDAVLRGVAAFFRGCADRGERGEAPESLMNAIDRALRVVSNGGRGGIGGNALDAMVGLRRALFPGAAGPADTGPIRGAAPMHLQLAAE
jgi:uncharacterized membrane protein YccC